VLCAYLNSSYCLHSKLPPGEILGPFSFPGKQYGKWPLEGRRELRTDRMLLREGSNSPRLLSPLTGTPERNGPFLLTSEGIPIKNLLSRLNSTGLLSRVLVIKIFGESVY
jgi:hypothetical protein